MSFKLVLLIRWSIATLLGLVALAGLFSNDVLPALYLLVLAFLISPLSNKWLFNKLKSQVPTWTKVLIGFLLFLGFATTIPHTSKQSNSLVAGPTNTQSPTPISQDTSIQTASQSATPQATPSWFDGKEKAVVARVVDGDTIKLDNGKVVRYIGIDTPETVDPSQPIQCFGKEASAFNKQLVEGKEVWLEKDVSETDRYGRLLRYIYVLMDGDNLDTEGLTFVNKLLVSRGYAVASSYPPDVKYQDDFRQLEEEARTDKAGMWADDACPNPTTTPTVAPTTKPVTTSTNSNSNYSQPSTVTNTTTTSIAGSFVCDCSKTCANMSSCAEAQYQLNTCGCKARDGDGDGIACDSDCQ